MSAAVAGLTGALVAHLLLLVFFGRDAQTESLTPFALGMLVAAVLGGRHAGGLQHRTRAAVTAALSALVLIYVVYAVGVAVGFYTLSWSSW